MTLYRIYQNLKLGKKSQKSRNFGGQNNNAMQKEERAREVRKRERREREKKRAVLEDPRLSFVIFVYENAEEQPKESGIINTEQNTSHFNNKTSLT